MRFRLTVAAIGIATLCAAIDEHELEPIRYSDTQPQDPVAALGREIAAGKLLPESDSDLGFLRHLLTRLDVAVETQTLVFSKTSLQRNLIGPHQPRALFFNDEIYVGWIPGGDIEISSFDARLGPIFYQLTPPKRGQKVEFYRTDQCLSCHVNAQTGRVPGLLMRSVFADKAGFPLTQAGSFHTGSDSPMSERWGGWLVTGQHGDLRHMGNALAEPTEANQSASLDREKYANLADLKQLGRFEPTDYPHDESDVLTLLVLEHQVTMHNILTEAMMNTRIALLRWLSIKEALEGKVGDQPLDGSALTVVDHYTKKILREMLFTDAADIGSGITGSAAFRKAFAAGRRPGPGGDSLRDLSLQGHVFANRCSYLIYSASFEGLPKELKTSIGKALRLRLASPADYEESQHLPADECARISAILDHTLKGQAWFAPVGV
jgi:hypothetical protein